MLQIKTASDYHFIENAAACVNYVDNENGRGFSSQPEEVCSNYIVCYASSSWTSLHLFNSHKTLFYNDLKLKGGKIWELFVWSSW